MKTVKRATDVLKGLADSTRLRAVNLLHLQELNVSELCSILHKEQSLMSKHLGLLRALEIVSDRKEGSSVYYYLRKSKNKAFCQLMKSVTEGFTQLELIRKDAIVLQRRNMKMTKKERAKASDKK